MQHGVDLQPDNWVMVLCVMYASKPKQVVLFHTNAFIPASSSNLRRPRKYNYTQGHRVPLGSEDPLSLGMFRSVGKISLENFVVAMV